MIADETIDGVRDPADWSDLTAPVNPFTNAKIIGVGVPAEVYLASAAKRGHKDYAMSRSALMEFAKCPKRWVNGYREDATTEKDWGSLLDCLVLEPAKFAERFATTPDTYGPDNKKWNFNATECKEWRKAHEAKQIVKPSDVEEAEIARRALMADEKIAEFVNCSDKQVMVVAEYRDEETGIGVPVKCLIDLVPDVNMTSKFADDLGDLKTCSFAAPGFWVKQVEQFNYHVQASLYLDTFNAATGEKRNGFRHVIQENYPPYQTAKRWLTDEFIKLGRKRYKEALKRYAACLKAGEWPDYDDGGQMNIDGWRETAPTDYMMLNQ